MTTEQSVALRAVTRTTDALRNALASVLKPEAIEALWPLVRAYGKAKAEAGRVTAPPERRWVPVCVIGTNEPEGGYDRMAGIDLGAVCGIEPATDPDTWRDDPGPATYLTVPDPTNERGATTYVLGVDLATACAIVNGTVPPPTAPPWGWFCAGRKCGEPVPEPGALCAECAKGGNHD